MNFLFFYLFIFFNSVYAESIKVQYISKEEEGVSIKKSWCRVSSGKTSAVYGKIFNPCKDKNYYLVGVSSPNCDKAEIHETINQNGVYRMRPQERILIDRSSSVVLQPGGYHIMLLGLKAPLKEKEHVEVIFKFEEISLSNKKRNQFFTKIMVPVKVTGCSCCH